jgi:hypothetical protein
VRHGGVVLGGAKHRLVAASIPFRYFVAALLFHAASWAVAIAGAEQIPGYAGGPGLPLAALHLLTIGVLVATAMGVAFQLLPVATKVPATTLWPARLAAWLLIPGTPVLAHGMAIGEILHMEIGGALVIAAIALFILLVADNVRRATGLAAVTAHVWAALASLTAVAFLAGLLVVDYDVPFLADRAGIALAHAILAVYGFMGLLALGFSHVLVPMFALSQPPTPRAAYASLAAACAAIALGLLGTILHHGPTVAFGALLGLIGAGVHVHSFLKSLHGRLRKHLGFAFVLVHGGWALLPVSLGAAAAAALDLPVPNLPTLFGFIAIFGWLLTFLLGILQKIMPFLAAMHAARAGVKLPQVSQIAPELPLRLHAIAHAAALTLVSLGIVSDSAWAVRIGATLGLAGAMLFAWFGAVVVWRMMYGVPGLAPAARKVGS